MKQAGIFQYCKRDRGDGTTDEQGPLEPTCVETLPKLKRGWIKTELDEQKG